jgi:WD40 repeat protein
VAYACDGEVRIGEVATCGWRVAYRHSSYLHRLTFANDGAHLVSVANSGATALFTTATGAVTWIGQHGPVPRFAAFSADGRLLALGGADPRIEIWDTATAERLRVLIGHENLIYKVTFAPAGHLLASSGADGTLRTWDAETGDGDIFREHDGDVRGVVFAPDGRSLASVSSDGTLRLWPLAERPRPPKEPAALLAWIGARTSMEIEDAGSQEAEAPSIAAAALRSRK